MLDNLLRFVGSKIDAVDIAILHTYSMLIQNIKKPEELSNFSVILDYLLSDSLLTKVIIAPYNFDNNDLTTQYVAFLKSVAIRLDTKTVVLLFNDVSLLNVIEN